MHRFMTPARWLAVVAIVPLLVCGAIACSSEAGPPLDPGGDGSADASGDVADAALGDDSTGDADAGLGDAADSATLPDARAPALDASLDAPAEAGPPSLAALSVTAPPADASPPIVLIPPFSPDIHDYYVRCEAGPNVLTVSMTASASAESLLLQPTPSPSLPKQTLSVRVNENQAVVVAATNATATIEYWVRCLPHDFPVMQWTAHAAAGTPPAGYYLLGTGGSLGPASSGCYAMVLDGNGVPVWYHPAKWANGFCVFDVDNAVSGAISFDSISRSPPGFEVHHLNPPATTVIAPSVDAGAPLNVDLHELLVLPNGNSLVISSPAQPGVDVTGMQIPQPDGGVQTLSGPHTILACNLLELAPDGTVVWTWKATDHFDAVKDSVAPTLTPGGPFGANLVDPFHCNAVDVDRATGNLLVSARQMSSIFYVERSTGLVLWKMGGAVFSSDNAAYVAVPDPFAQQHDARFQPDWSSTCNGRGGSGHISLFDNETGAASPARGVVYDVVVGDAAADGGCGSSGTATVAWQYKGQASSPAMGSFRILPDGSRVIGWGLVGAPGPAFSEVDVNGNKLLDFAFLDGNTTYRAIKVPLSAFDRADLRASLFSSVVDGT